MLDAQLKQPSMGESVIDVAATAFIQIASLPDEKFEAL